MRAHISFQNTEGVNISSVNCLFEVNLYVPAKGRGCGDARQIYSTNKQSEGNCILGVTVQYHLLKNWDQELEMVALSDASWEGNGSHNGSFHLF